MRGVKRPPLFFFRIFSKTKILIILKKIVSLYKSIFNSYDRKFVNFQTENQPLTEKMKKI